MKGEIMEELKVYDPVRTVNNGTIGKELAGALPAMLGEMKNAKNTMKGYGYKYAPLNEILDTARPILTKHKFTIMQFVGSEESLVTVTTRLTHESGEFLESTMVLPLARVAGANDVQQMGASITYARRYMITAVLGIAGEEDTDGVENPKPEPKDSPKPVGKPVAPQKPVDYKASCEKAVKMIDTLIETNTSKLPEGELAAMMSEYEQIRAQPDDEQKYLALRGFYSNVSKFIKNL
jgi:hypothetical protein